MPRVGLTFTGDADAQQWLPGVPAADHNAPDAIYAAPLLASGLYAKGTVQPELVETPAAAEPEPAFAPEPRKPYWWLPPAAQEAAIAALTAPALPEPDLTPGMPAPPTEGEPAPDGKVG